MIFENLFRFIQIAVMYFIVCVLLPSGLLKSRVKDRSLAFRVLFYQIVSNLYITFWGFFFSFTHLYYSWSIWLTTVILPAALLCYEKRGGIREGLMKLVKLERDKEKGFLGGRSIRRRAWKWIRVKGAALYGTCLNENAFHLAAILAITVFVVLFYGYFRLHHYSYACTDEETHLYWIQSLTNNILFPMGMYPYGMHFLVGALVTLIGAPAVSLYLNFSILNALLVHITAYLFLNRIFKNKAAVIAGMGLFLILDIFSVGCYFRYQYSMPMEFGMTAMFALMFMLVSFLEDHSRLSLAAFGMALIWTVEAHFYVTIFCAFICLAAGVVYLIPLCRSGSLHKLLICGVMSLVLAIIPYGIGYACGFTFESAIGWGISSMQSGNDESAQEGEDPAARASGADTAGDICPIYDELDDTEIDAYYDSYDLDTEISAIRNLTDFGSLVTMWAMYGLTNTVAAWKLIVLLWAFEMAYALLALIRSFKKDDNGSLRAIALRYLFVGMTALFGFICYSCRFLNLPSVLNTYRAADFEALMCIPLMCMPFQTVCDIAELLPTDRKKRDIVLSLAAFALVGIVCIGEDHLRSIHDVYYDFAIDDADMRTCVNLLNSADNYTWTVISPTNDLSAIRYNGYHYEIIDLLEAIEDGEAELYISTRDIYIVVEKKIADFYHARGDRRYIDDRDLLENTYDINPQKALLTLEELGQNEWSSTDRAYYEGREGVMSKLYYWMEKIKAVYPAETEVWYEDETCCVYHLSQDIHFPLNLAVDYMDMIPAESPEQAG